MTTNRSSFSILIPVYKGSPYLKDALESIYLQGFPFLEIILCDDNDPANKDEIEKTKEIIYEFKTLIKSRVNKNDLIGVTSEVTLRPQYALQLRGQGSLKQACPPKLREGGREVSRVTESIRSASCEIKYYKNNTNLGSQGNIKKLASLAKGDILFYLCQDDILLKNALQITHDAFSKNKDIGVVTRPFYWFEDDPAKPIRAVFPPNRYKDTVLSIFDGEHAIKHIFGSVGQISGLAYRKNLIETPFHLDIFPGHIYPFAGILKRSRCVFLKDFTVAVRIKSSQSRHISSIYGKSPLESWVKMFNTVYSVKKLEVGSEKLHPTSNVTLLTSSDIKRWGIKHIATHYEGLVQIKNFGPRGALLREIKNHVKYYWPSIFHPKFWFYSLITLLLPRTLLLPLSDSYKRHILSRILKNKQILQIA